jgi:4-amino-4-deoxy-L-arabinose transferase-like glycosyltransferase
MIEQNSQIDNYVRKFKLVARRGVYSPLVILFLVIIAFHLLTLFRTPGPHVDESWNASRAWGFLQSGKNFGPLDSGVFDKFDGYWTFFPSLVTWIYSLFVKMIGPTLAAVRYTSLLFGCILLTIIYFLVSLIYDRNIGLLSIFLVAVSSSFLFSSHLGRQDIIVAVFAYSAFSFYLVDKSQRFSLLSIISGLLASLAFEVHPPIGVIVIPSLGILYILDNGISFIRLKRFWGFAAGSVVGFVFLRFLAYHSLPSNLFSTYAITRAVAIIAYSDTVTLFMV